MSLGSAPKKRKRKVDSCPNPLFVKWLTEWRDDAASQGKKTQYAFSKALQALKKYPMPLSSGKEAKILDHFGDKICNMLDHKLAKHIEENGEDSVWPVDNDDASSSSHGSTTRPSTMGQMDCSLAIPPPPDINTVGQILRKRRPSNRAPREYVPVYSSGPYALMLTLYREYKKPTSKGFMLKTELQREAAPLSEKSFTIPDPGCHYTAWSSMSTLINKGYVIKEGSPARYSITEAGCLLASKLETVDAAFGQHPCDSSCPVDKPTVNNKPAASRKRKEVTRMETTAHVCNATSLAAHSATHQPPHSDRLEYWYIDDHGNQVRMKDEAAVTVDGRRVTWPPKGLGPSQQGESVDRTTWTRHPTRQQLITDGISIGFRIKADEAALKRSGVRYKRDYTVPTEGSMILAYLHNDDASEYCPIPTTSCLQAKATSRSNLPLTADSLPSLPSFTMSKTTVPSTSKLRHTKSVPPATNGLTDSPHSTSSSCLAIGKYSIMRPDSQPSHSSVNSISSSSISTQHRNSSQNSWKTAEPNSMNSQGSSSSVLSFPSTSSDKTEFWQSASSQNIEAGSLADSKEPSAPLYVLEPGTFDIVLCVDSCETAGGAVNGRKQLLLPELQKNGVTLDVRKLQVGDFLWIAREKRVPVPGMLQMPSARELVLDYVVERKRMDDLCGSIMDGRFKEQKFRLKQSGLRKPIYLIEDFGSIDHMSIPATTLRQAITNTQVIDGFFVKHSKDNKESAAYLTIMTRYLQGHYSNKTLEAYHRDDLGNLHGNRRLTSPIQKLMTFTELNTSSMKNKNTTVTETFAKQLLQFSGLTAEKALAITKQYPTPSDLLDAYNNCTVKDRERLLSRIKYGKLQRNVGPMLSKLIHMFYCTDGPLT